MITKIITCLVIAYFIISAILYIGSNQHEESMQELLTREAIQDGRR